MTELSRFYASILSISEDNSKICFPMWTTVKDNKDNTGKGMLQPTSWKLYVRCEHIERVRETA